MTPKRLMRQTVRMGFVLINTVVCGFLLFLAGFALTGPMPGADAAQNAFFILGALAAGITLVALFPEYSGTGSPRRLARTANLAVVVAGFYVLWRGAHGAENAIVIDSLLCWGFGSANLLALAVTNERGEGGGSA